jgi:hypothetical protein
MNYHEAQRACDVVQRVLDRIRDEGTTDTVPNLWDSVALSLNEVAAFLRSGATLHADGFFKIGFQRLFRAPAHVTRAVEQYHEAIEILRSKRKVKR